MKHRMCFLPSQECLSNPSRYPGLQEQSNSPSVLLHTCSQLSVSVIHSFISKSKDKVCVIMCISNMMNGQIQALIEHVLVSAALC